MKDLLDKLSPYNLFNYLLPGVLFAAFGEAVSNFKLLHEDIIIGVFIYYFYGLVISRVGSVVVEPSLKWIKFLHFASYGDFVEASKSDQKLEVLSEANNMYRTLCTVFLVLIVLRFSEQLLREQLEFTGYFITFGIGALFALFAFAYRKQTIYITRRISKTLAIGNSSG